MGCLFVGAVGLALLTGCGWVGAVVWGLTVILVLWLVDEIF